MFGCNTHLLKHIKQAILAWSFRQNIILGCYPVFAAISARDEFIVSLSIASRSANFSPHISGFLLILLVESMAHKLFGGEGHSHFPAEKRNVTGLQNNAFEV